MDRLHQEDYSLALPMKLWRVHFFSVEKISDLGQSWQKIVFLKKDFGIRAEVVPLNKVVLIVAFQGILPKIR